MRTRVVNDALWELGGLAGDCGTGRFEVIPPPYDREFMEGWREAVGEEEFLKLVNMLRGGHIIQSPVVPSFRYSNVGVAGRQQQLGIT